MGTAEGSRAGCGGADHERTATGRPPTLAATTRSFQFLTGWVLRLLKLGGWEASGADTSEIRARIEDLYAFEPERRTLSVLAGSLPSATWPAWSRWTQGGAWGGYFDYTPYQDLRTLHVVQ